MKSADRLDRAAAHLGALRQSRELVSFPDDLCPTSEDEAYGVQAAHHVWLREDGQGDTGGYKIGCTTPVMQEILQIPTPAFGTVLDRRIYNNHADFTFADYHRPGIECEIAMRLGTDLSPTDAPYTRDTVSSAVATCMAAIELVDNRYGEFLSVGAPVMMADDFFHSACVIGAESGDWKDLDLAGIEGRTFINGKLAGSGPGSDVLGHPLEALAWLANRFAGLGRTLKAGDLIMTGSLVAVQWLEAAPVDVMISIDGLGDVSLRMD